MTYQRNHLGSYGMIVVIEEVYKTDWVQLRGEELIRCDDEAKETGRGAWIIEKPGPALNRFRGWTGRWPAGSMAWPLDPELWIADELVRITEFEKDVS